MKPSDVVECYRVASRGARRIGQEFVLSETRLEQSGFSQKQIDAIFVEIEWVEDMERQLRMRLSNLDTRTAAT